MFKRKLTHKKIIRMWEKQITKEVNLYAKENGIKKGSIDYYRLIHEAREGLYEKVLRK